MDWESRLIAIWEDAAPYLDEASIWVSDLRIEHVLLAVAVIILLQGMAVSRALKSERQLAKDLSGQVKALKALLGNAAAYAKDYQYATERRRPPSKEDALKLYRREAE